jgi:hypothetical protein
VYANERRKAQQHSLCNGALHNAGIIRLWNQAASQTRQHKEVRRVNHAAARRLAANCTAKLDTHALHTMVFWFCVAQTTH